MSTVTRPRGPLPARVYWTRRLLVGALAFALVFGLSRLLGGTGTEPPGKASARPVGAEPTRTTPAAPVSTAGAGPEDRHTTDKQKDGHRKKQRPTRTPLAVPTGPCADADVQVTPTVPEPAHAGSKVVFALELRTLESAACTWTVSPRSLVVKLTSGDDRIWTTQDCPAAVPDDSVVVRQAHKTTIEMTWNGQRSDASCSRTTPWAQPGYYHVQAAALGAEPVETQFELGNAVRPTITPSPTPRHKEGKKAEPR